MRLPGRKFRIHPVGDGGVPPPLVLLVPVVADVDATHVSAFSTFTQGRVGDTCSASVHRFPSGDRFSFLTPDEASLSF